MEGASVEELHASATENGGGTLGLKTSTWRSALGRVLSFACLNSAGSLRDIPAVRPARRGPACVDHGSLHAADKRILVAGLSRTFSELFDGPRLTT